MPEKLSPNQILLSTDTLPWFWLDLVFKIAKQAGFDGIDLALWRNYDAWHEQYVADLSTKYDLPIVVVQTSEKTNAKELNKAIQLCELTHTKHILINSPKYFDVRSYNFLTNNIKNYQKQYPQIEFWIINPDDSSMSYLPFPKYRFRHIGEIIKKFNLKLGFDIANMDEETIQTLIIGQWKETIKNMTNCYVTDRNKSANHLAPWEGSYNIPSILKSLSKNNYSGPLSIKIHLDPKTLIDNEKMLFQLQKSIEYIRKHS